MNNKLTSVLPLSIVVVALLVSMYLVFNTDSLLASKAGQEAKQFIAGASCPVSDNSLISNSKEAIQFVGCGGFF